MAPSRNFGFIEFIDPNDRRDALLRTLRSAGDSALLDKLFTAYLAKHKAEAANPAANGTRIDADLKTAFERSPSEVLFALYCRSKVESLELRARLDAQDAKLARLEDGVSILAEQPFGTQRGVFSRLRDAWLAFGRAEPTQPPTLPQLSGYRPHP